MNNLHPVTKIIQNSFTSFTKLHIQFHELHIIYNYFYLTDYFKENDQNDPEPSGDNNRYYQSIKKHFEEKKSGSSSFVSSIEDEQKPLFTGIADYPSVTEKTTEVDFEEMVHATEEILIDKRSNSCKGNIIGAIFQSLSRRLIWLDYQK